MYEASRCMDVKSELLEKQREECFSNVGQGGSQRLNGWKES